MSRVDLPGAGHTIPLHRACDPTQARQVAVTLIGTGLHHLEPDGDLPGMARDVAQALGLIPTVPAIAPFVRGESGAAGRKRRASLAARKDQTR